MNTKQKLTMEIRDAIIKGALDHRFGADEKAIEQGRRELARDIYTFSYGQALIDQMNALPDGVCPTDQKIRFKRADDPRRATSLYLGDYFRQAAYGDDYLKVLPKSLDNRLAKFDEREKTLQAAKGAAERDLCSALAQFKTVKALALNWPEMVPFIPKWACREERKPQPLVVPIKDINKLFKLPVKDQQAVTA